MPAKEASRPAPTPRHPWYGPARVLVAALAVLAVAGPAWAGPGAGPEGQACEGLLGDDWEQLVAEGLIPGEDPQSARPAPDLPPAVSVTRPLDGDRVSGLVLVMAEAEDERAVDDVWFRLDGADLQGTTTTGYPWEASWDARLVPGGSHTITALARDCAGHVAESAPVRVTVGARWVSAGAGLPGVRAVLSSGW